MGEKQELSGGQKAVGVNFNPSQDHNVKKLKDIFAEAFDVVEALVEADDGTLEVTRKRKMRDVALGHIITAQMWAVKIATLDK